MPKIKKETYLLITIMLFSVLAIFYLVSFKEYLYIDEAGSYAASNNPIGIFVDLDMDTWYQGSDMITPFTAQEGHTFDYSIVWRNQSADTHPPIYFALLHTICSFFPGVFSQWFALLINLISLLIIEVVVYKIGKLLFSENQWMPLICVVAYAGSMSVVIQTLFYRMYMVQQIFTSLLLLIHIASIKGMIKNKRFYIQLFFITVLGTLTHYYYLIFAFLLAAGYCLYLLINKKIREVLYYVLTMICSAAAIILVYPAITRHLFGGEIGGTVVNNILQTNRIKERLVTIYASLNMEIFGSCFKLLFVITAIYLVIKIYHKQISLKQLKEMDQQTKAIYGIMLIIAIPYYVFVSMTTPYLCDRYFAPIFLILILILVKLLYTIFQDVFKSETLLYVVLIALLLCPYYQYLSSDHVDTNKLEMLRVAEENADTVCIIEPNLIKENFMELSKYDRIFATDLRHNPTSCEAIKNDDQFIIYLPNDIDINAYFEMIQQGKPTITHYERLYVGYESTVYLFQ